MKESVLITGATGFLGKYILNTYLKDNINVTILTRKILHDNNQVKQIIGDLTNKLPDLANMSFDTIIHNAGLAHIIPKNNIQAEAFFKVNTEGTKNLLYSIEKLNELPKRIIFISTAAVYGLDNGTDITEEFPLKSTTPYALSKIKAESIIQQWCTTKNIEYFILRLPLVVGKNPPGNLGALFRSIQRGKYAYIKNNHAKKSMVLASDVAELVKQINGPSGIYNINDRIHPTINQMAYAIAFSLNKKIKFTIPKSLLFVLSKIGDFFIKVNLYFPIDTKRFNKITLDLTFSDELARKNIHWKSNSCIEFIKKKGL